MNRARAVQIGVSMDNVPRLYSFIFNILEMK